MMRKKIIVFWFRRDLRLFDNNGLYQALDRCRQENLIFFPLFIFDKQILAHLAKHDSRVAFIAGEITKIQKQFKDQKIDLNVFHDDPENVFRILSELYEIKYIIANHDYEPYARKRDRAIGQFAKQKNFSFLTFKDQVVFEKQEILTDAEKPYTVFTAYKKKWLAKLTPAHLKEFKIDLNHVEALSTKNFVNLAELGFRPRTIKFPEADFRKQVLQNYETDRNFPALESGTSRLGLHLRFGTVSVRQLVKSSQAISSVWLSELIWREFFMQILWNFPDVETKSFRPQYEKIKWLKNKSDFERWTTGQTGYPLVDAGMRELIQTGHMHNRVRMVTASFLTKHLLHHWYEGERFFAQHLLDYDLSANNGNWQWAAGTGCDAAPYFRIFNPQTQLEKFDADLTYVKKWIPEFTTQRYPQPMIEHKVAYVRCLQTYKEGLK
jgi:deoxyribodipyrimidine photo-lyase